MNSVAVSLMNQFVPLPNFGNLFTFNPFTVN